MRFHHLTFLPEGEEVVVGRPDTDVYGVFPEDGAALLRELQAGRSPADAADWYRGTYGETVAIDEFVATLHELTFVVTDDEDTAANSPAPVRWQRLGRALFSPVGWLLMALAFAAGVAVCFIDPAFAPRRSNIVFSEYLLVVELTVILGQIPLALVHESFHVLAARRLGLQSKVRLGQRFYFVVFETVLDGLVAVPRRARYLPMLAGMLADALVMAALTLTAFVTRTPDGPSALGAVCLALAFTTLPRVAWQFYFFLRTDIYYLVTTVLGCIDLQTTSRQLLANRVNRALGRHERLFDEHQWHPRDRKAARWYAPLVVVGYGVSLAMLLLVVAPLAWEFFGQAIDRVLFGSGSTAQAIDAAGLLAVNGGQVVLAAVLAIRQRRRSNPSQSNKEKKWTA